MNVSFKQTMNGIIDVFKGMSPAWKTAHKQDDAVFDAVEDVIERTDWKIRLVRNYQAKLAPGVVSSMAYFDTLVERIPGVVDVGRSTFATDPRVNAFFVNVDDMHTIFSRSAELREFLDERGSEAPKEIHALLCMQKQEKQTFGMELNDGIVRRDVRQVAVNFSDHQILSPGGSEAEVRQGLKKCLFDGLVTCAFERLYWNHPKFREGKRHKSCSGYAQSTNRRPASAPDRNEDEIRPDTPLDHLVQVSDVLSHPERFVRLKNTSIRINKMGLKTSERSADSGNRIELAEVEMDGAPTRVVVLVKYRADEVSAKPDFLELAHRYLAV